MDELVNLMADAFPDLDEEGGNAQVGPDAEQIDLAEEFVVRASPATPLKAMEPTKAPETAVKPIRIKPKVNSNNRARFLFIYFRLSPLASCNKVLFLL